MLETNKEKAEQYNYMSENLKDATYNAKLEIGRMEEAHRKEFEEFTMNLEERKNEEVKQVRRDVAKIQQRFEMFGEEDETDTEVLARSIKNGNLDEFGKCIIQRSKANVKSAFTKMFGDGNVRVLNFDVRNKDIEDNTSIKDNDKESFLRAYGYFADEYFLSLLKNIDITDVKKPTIDNIINIDQAVFKELGTAVAEWLNANFVGGDFYPILNKENMLKDFELYQVGLHDVTLASLRKLMLASL